METIFGIFWALLTTLLSVAWWIASYLVWIIVWFLLPFLVLAFIALRAAEKAFGTEVVRAWVKARAMRFGTGTWDRVRPWLFALGKAPFRVLVWFVVFSVWHALVSLMWRPRWHPWTRAWERRWKAQKLTPSGRVVKDTGKKA